MALPDGGQIHVNDDGDWDLPIGTVLMKEFSLGGKRVETRLLVHHDDGDWAGYSYEWSDDQTDATLLPASKTKDLGNGQTWYFPSRTDCLQLPHARRRPLARPRDGADQPRLRPTAAAISSTR